MADDRASRESGGFPSPLLEEVPAVSSSQPWAEVAWFQGLLAGSLL